MASKPLVESRLDGKFAVVTGANAGIGKVTALELARAGARVVLACRSDERARAAMAEISAQVPGAALDFVRLDLASLQSVREAAEEIRALSPRIDLLINNAGLAGQKGQTTEGFELTFGTNHLGPFLLTKLLLDRVQAATQARIVNVASRAHYRTGPLEFSRVRTPTPFSRA